MSIEVTPWDDIARYSEQSDDEVRLKAMLLDEYYTELYRIREAEKRMQTAECMMFMGTSISVNITNIALGHATMTGALIEVVDPDPMDIGIPNIVYHQMSVHDFIPRDPA